MKLKPMLSQKAQDDLRILIYCAALAGLAYAASALLFS